MSRDPLTAEELEVLPRLRLDIDAGRFEAYRPEDVRRLLDIIDRLDHAARSAHSLPVGDDSPSPDYGPCATRLDNQPTPSIRPWHYGHAASIEGAHWDIYAGEGIDGWLVGMVTTEADAALIVAAVNSIAANDLSARLSKEDTDDPT